jgi:hypothetical protein
MPFFGVHTKNLKKNQNAFIYPTLLHIKLQVFSQNVLKKIDRKKRSFKSDKNPFG